MLSGWETSQGKKYFFCRYSKMTLEELKAESIEVEKECILQPEKSMLLLVDVSGMIISPAVFDVLQKLASDLKNRLIKTAVLGVTGVRRNMLDLMIKLTGLSIHSFESKAEAVDWLLT